MEKDEIFNILTEHAINERLAKIVLEDDGYVKTKEKADLLLVELEKINSTQEVHELLDNYDSIVHEAAAIYACFAYKQGTKDMFNLFMSFKKKRADRNMIVLDIRTIILELFLLCIVVANIIFVLIRLTKFII